MDFHESVECRSGQCGVLVLVVSVSFFELRLLSQHGSGCTTFEFFEHASSFVVLQTAHEVTGLGIQFVHTPTGSGIFLRVSARGQQDGHENSG